MSDQVAVMNAGQFEQVGTPQELYYEPAQRPSSRASSATATAGSGQRASRGRRRVRVELPSTGRRARRAARRRTARPRRAAMPVEVFVRPAAIAIARAGNVAGRGENRLRGHGRQPALQRRRQPRAGPHRRRRASSQAALPATGAHADLKPASRSSSSGAQRQTICFRDGGLARRCRPRTPAGSRLILLLTPFAALDPAPHRAAACRHRAVCRCAKRSGRGHTPTASATTLDFVGEPIYWNTLLRTAVMSILVTGAHAGRRLSGRLLHRQDRAAADARGAVPALPDPALGRATSCARSAG